MKKSNKDDIQIRCSYTKLADITELIANPRNPNKHGDQQIAMLAKIIRHQGWRSPVVVSKRSGFIVAGHGRTEAAKLLGVQTVPVDYQDFSTEADEWAHLIADNRLAELAEFDFQEVSKILKELDGDLSLDLTGFLSHELDNLLKATWQPDAVEPFDTPAEFGASITLTKEQRAIFDQARTKAEAAPGESDGRVLELICGDYLAGA